MRRRSARFVSDDERRLWHAAMHDTKPLHPQQLKAAPAKPPPVNKQPAAAQAPAPQLAPNPVHKPKTVQRSTAAINSSNPGIDKQTWRRLKRGSLSIEGRLDLHGLTQSEAHDRLHSFLQAMQAKGARCVLVITGMGRRDGGILKQMTPRWLAEPSNRRLINGFAAAEPKHGGAGALYVLIKRPRQ